MDFTQQERQVFSKMGKARFIGKTPEEISKMMSIVRRKGLEKKAKNSLLTNRS